jgi:hypothetical protein
LRSVYLAKIALVEGTSFVGHGTEPNIGEAILKAYGSRAGSIFIAGALRSCRLVISGVQRELSAAPLQVLRRSRDKKLFAKWTCVIPYIGFGLIILGCVWLVLGGANSTTL